MYQCIPSSVQPPPPSSSSFGELLGTTSPPPHANWPPGGGRGCGTEASDGLWPAGWVAAAAWAGLWRRCDVFPLPPLFPSAPSPARANPSTGGVRLLFLSSTGLAASANNQNIPRPSLHLLPRSAARNGMPMKGAARENISPDNVENDGCFWEFGRWFKSKTYKALLSD